MDSRSFHGHNSRPASPIELRSNKVCKKTSRGTMYALLDFKNRFTLKWVIHDKVQFEVSFTWFLGQFVSRVIHLNVNRFLTSWVWIVPLDVFLHPFFDLNSIGQSFSSYDRENFSSPFNFQFFGQNFKKIIFRRQKNLK